MQIFMVQKVYLMPQLRGGGGGGGGLSFSIFSPDSIVCMENRSKDKWSEMGTTIFR